MANRARGKGTWLETAEVHHFQANGFPHAHRLPISSPFGDLDGICSLAVTEVKNHVKLDLAGWAAQAEKSAKAAHRPWWWVIHKRKGKGKPEDQWVTMTVSTLTALLQSSLTDLPLEGMVST